MTIFHVQQQAIAFTDKKINAFMTVTDTLQSSLKYFSVYGSCARTQAHPDMHKMTFHVIYGQKCELWKGGKKTLKNQSINELLGFLNQHKTFKVILSKCSTLIGCLCYERCSNFVDNLRPLPFYTENPLWSFQNLLDHFRDAVQGRQAFTSSLLLECSLINTPSIYLKLWKAREKKFLPHIMVNNRSTEL